MPLPCTLPRTLGSPLALICIGVPLTVTSLTYAALHTVNEVRLRRSAASSGAPAHVHLEMRSWPVRKNILLFNWWSFLACAGSFWGIVAQSGIRDCRITLAWGLFVYCLHNLLLYRVLIVKSNLVDHTGRSQCIKRVAWWILNLFFLPIILAASLSPFLHLGLESRKEELCGQEYCVYKPSIILSLLLGGIDCFLGVWLTYLYVDALRNPARHESVSRNAAVIRKTVFWTFIAIVSTLFVFIFHAALAIGEHFGITSVAIAVAAMDVTINVCALNLTWASKYYWRALNYTLPRIFKGAEDIPPLDAAQPPRLSLGMGESKRSLEWIRNRSTLSVMPVSQSIGSDSRRAKSPEAKKPTSPISG